jgi:hypothetical protein
MSNFFTRSFAGMTTKNIARSPHLIAKTVLAASGQPGEALLSD